MAGLTRRGNWIATLPARVQVAIRERMATIELGTRQTLNEAHDVPAGLYELDNGFIKLCRLRPDGGLRFLALYAAGSAFGETALVTRRPRHEHSSVALAPCRVRVLAAYDFHDLTGAHPEMMAALCEKFAALVSDLLRSEDFAVATRLRSRIALMLTSLATDLGQLDPDGRAHFTLPISHTDIAQHVDATRQAVQRELATLTRLRLVERSGSRWTLPDPSRLRAI